MKERIQARVASLKAALSAGKKKLVALWKDPEDALLFRGVVILLALAGTAVVGGVAAFWKIRHTHSVALKSPVEPLEEESPSKKDADPVIGVRAIPKEISRRQDGVPEADKDLVEPEIRSGRGLASIVPEKTEPTAPYNPFLTYNEILGSTSEQASRVGRVALDIAFEVDSHFALRELQEREKEVKFMISSLIAELPYDELRTDEGRLMLKKRIFQEVNYLLKSGKIRDVLYSNFVMR